jgi:phosphatidylinositol-3-phosphatase
MRVHIQLASAICIYACLLVSNSPRLAAQAPVPHSSHVVLLVDENTGYDTAVAEMPYLVSLGFANGHAANYSSDTSGSLMDYLWLASGSCESSANCALPAGTHDFGCNGNSCAEPVTDDNIFREMNNRGISWKVYAQSYAAAGGKVTTPDLANGTHYYRRHNGATWYSDILDNVDESQSRIVDFSHFATDLANNALPQFTIIAPDGINDGHDSSPATADAFLSATLPSLLAKPYFQPGGDGLLIITFDNADGDQEGEVDTLVVGPNVTPNVVSETPYKHQNALRTMLDALGISTHPGASAGITSMTDFFSGYVTVTSPAQNAVTGTEVLVTATATESNAKIHQVQVWDKTTGKKLGQSASGTSTINQTFSLAPGKHTLVVEDISAENFDALHKADVSITVSAEAP